MDWLRSTISFLGTPSRRQNPQGSTVLLPGHYPNTSDENDTSRQGVFANMGDHINDIIIKPVAIIVYIALSILGKILRVVYFHGTANALSTVNSGTTVNNALMNDPIRRVEHFVRDLEESLSPSQQFASNLAANITPNLPPFFLGSYTQALFMASSRAKFLFIYLTNSKNEGAQSLFESVITNPKFVSIFKNDQAIIWGGDLTNPEAYQLANSLNITKFPMIGILCLTRTTTMTPEGPRKSNPRISLVSKMQGGLRDYQSPESLIYNKFVKRMMKYEPDLSVIRAELKDKYLSEAMRRKQDLDYQRSLLRDQQKKAEKNRKKLMEKYLKWRQPYFKNLLKNKDVSDTSRIAIKFESGQRITLHFPRTATVLDIFVFVELYRRDMLQDTFEVIMSDNEARELFGNLDLKFEFSLTSSIPPRPSLNSIDPQSKIEDVNFIYPSGLLMVEGL